MRPAESQESLLQAVRECAELAGAFALRHYRAGVSGRSGRTMARR